MPHTTCEGRGLRGRIDRLGYKIDQNNQDVMNMRRAFMMEVRHRVGQ